MKTFCAFAVMAICLSAPLLAWSGPARAGETSEPAGQTPRPSHARTAHDYWLGNGLNRLALLLPSHKAGETDRR